MSKLAFFKIISIIISLWGYGLFSDIDGDRAIAQDDVLSTFDPQQWAEIMVAPHISESRSIDLNFPYATTDNFVKNQLYSCPRCFLRPEVATAVQQAHEKLQQLGYGGLRLFDCYRPLPVQWEMWQIVPDPRYVGNPQKGSDHNRGTAVDLTIVDPNLLILKVTVGCVIAKRNAPNHSQWCVTLSCLAQSGGNLQNASRYR